MGVIFPLLSMLQFSDFIPSWATVIQLLLWEGPASSSVFCVGRTWRKELSSSFKSLPSSENKHFSKAYNSANMNRPQQLFNMTETTSQQISSLFFPKYAFPSLLRLAAFLLWAKWIFFTTLSLRNDQTAQLIFNRQPLVWAYHHSKRPEGFIMNSTKPLS